MSWTLLDGHGQRKYLTASERSLFVEAARGMPPMATTFCLTMGLTGVRISEALGLTRDRVDVAGSMLVIETLKRRRPGVFRAIPVPHEFLTLLCEVHDIGRDIEKIESTERLWSCSRTTAWKWIKTAMCKAGIAASVAKPKALRHAFAVEAVRQRIALSLIKRWLGHSRIETTAIYADPVGDEERALAELTWRDLSLGT